MGFRSLVALSLIALSAQGCRVGSEAASDTSIIGGKDASYHPFMVAVRDARSGSHFCGGSWIGEGVVVTAAHCIYGETAKISVSVGSTDVKDAKQVNTLKVVSAVLHPDYKPDRDMKNDIALLFVESVDHSRLPRPIAPIELNSQRSFPRTGDIVTPIGWGNHSSYFGLNLGTKLQQVDVPVVSNATCRQGGTYYNLIEDDFEICAGHSVTGGQDACQGDSGGPLIAMVDGKAVLVGVVSWGIDCAQKNQPGVYTRVSKHVDWIKKEVERNKQPVTNESSLINAISAHCYSGFVGTERRSGQSYGFRYQLETLEKTDDAPVHDRSLSSCSFTRSDVGQVNVVVAPVGGKTYFFVTVGGETWIGPAVSQFQVETECVSQQDDFFVFKSFDSLGFEYNDERFVGTAAALPAVGTPSEAVTCKDPQVELTFNSYGTGGSKKNYVTVVFPKVSAEALTYSLEEFNEAPMSPTRGIKVYHDFVEPTKAYVEFKQHGNVDVFSWQLVCPFKYHLVGDDDAVFMPEDGRPNFYSVTFKHDTHSQGAIVRGEGVKFVMMFKNPATPEKLESCSINGMPIDVD